MAAEDIEAMTAADSQAAGSWLLGMLAGAEHADDGELGLSFSKDAIAGLMTVSHEGHHWLAQILAVAATQLGDVIAQEHGDPRPDLRVSFMLQRLIEHLGEAVG